MAYRNITVEGKDYQYVVGKTHVKVRGLEAVEKSGIGDEYVKDCGCCSEWRVKPAHIKEFIQAQS